ncbi:glycine betaine ABC transporter substrate-binding protein [Methanoplanus endosymbiosus]|uniref:Glycine/betaine ABC transporter n=1 Tax=Methanoplanus endosymbiosus TaxID=33865 RepID=A0A9E7TIT3_9EURY|nr:glycine betaine ABC transporter substrate-binding protein [Methanoplanus endosymbiosus]UUX91154.1 glycine/betaine ABC transporter [Methanoplanus endosymbiosus]
MNLINKRIVLVALIALAAVMIAGCTSQEAQTADKGKITGIEPGAGIMMMTENAIEDYGLDYDLVSSSSAGMASELTKAIKDEKWIVVTGWTPHWKFARYDLKYLDDPKGVYGGEEYIATLARTGLSEDKPDLYSILERFQWNPEDMGAVMLDAENGMKPEEAAEKWVDNNKETVTEWIGGVSSDGEKVEIGYVLWDSEIASTNVVKLVLEQAGFDVDTSAVDAGPLYQAVADGDVDFTISSWLPATHKSYLDKYEDKIVVVRKNLEGAKVGLVVPTYVTINSIDELNSVKEKFA